MHSFAKLARELGRFPTHGDFRVRKTSDADSPNHRVVDRRLGGKADKVSKVAKWARANAGNEDVLAMCEAATTAEEALEPPAKRDTAGDGHVYLLKSGKFYKIGFSVHAGARERQLAIQLPEAASTVHIIVA